MRKIEFNEITKS